MLDLGRMVKNVAKVFFEIFINKGKLTRADRVLEGTFEDDRLHGKGKQTYNNGSYYEGEFNMGQIHGNGKYCFSDTEWVEGEFVEGQINGKAM